MERKRCVPILNRLAAAAAGASASEVEQAAAEALAETLSSHQGESAMSSARDMQGSVPGYVRE